jgi:hypothetical protein
MFKIITIIICMPAFPNFEKDNVRYITYQVQLEYKGTRFKIHARC